MEPLPELILLFAIFAALVRSALYCSGVAPPFNLWGRIASGKIIVPGFDQVFLTPIAVVLAGIAGAAIIRPSGSWYAVTESCVIAGLWFLLFSGGPSLQNWVLTGQHRFRAPTRLNANKQQLRSI